MPAWVKGICCEQACSLPNRPAQIIALRELALPDDRAHGPDGLYKEVCCREHQTLSLTSFVMTF